MSNAYASTANELTKRVLALIPGHPEILTMESPWDLFNVEGFDCKDLQQSLYQAGFALREACRMYRENET